MSQSTTDQWSPYITGLLQGGCEFATLWGYGSQTFTCWASGGSLTLEVTGKDIKEICDFLLSQKENPCRSGKCCGFVGRKCMHINTLCEDGDHATTTCLFKQLGSESNEKICVAASLIDNVDGILIGASGKNETDRQVANIVDYYGRYLNCQYGQQKKQ